jgi:ribosomal protein L37AE/L43A
MSQNSLVERTDRLRIRDIQAAIPRYSLAATLQLEGRFGLQEVQVVGRLTNLRNGYRYFFLCPQCNQAFINLFRQDFGQYACRRCLGLFYASSMRVEIN